MAIVKLLLPMLLILFTEISSIVQEKWLVHTNLHTIEKVEMDTWSNITVVSGMVGAVSVDYHFTQGYLYFSDQQTDHISRTNLSIPGDKEIIITNNIDRADGIAVDWIYDHIYWVDGTHHHVMVASLDGTFRKTLINTVTVLSMGIVVHPTAGWLFFSDVGVPNIQKCGLDGSERQIIINTNKNIAMGLSIDFASNRLYWTDFVQEIRSSTLDGTDVRVVARSSTYLKMSAGLVVFQDWIYWTSYPRNSIYRVNKQIGVNFQTVKTNLSSPVGIKIYSSANQPSGTNICGLSNGNCEHLCLATPHSTFHCFCSDGYQLNSDGRSCLYIGSADWITFSNLHTIDRIDISNNVSQKIAGGLSIAMDLDIHYKKGLVYWTDVEKKRIYRSHTTRDTVTGIKEEVISEMVDVPDGIAIDWMYNLMFWTDTGHDHIQMAHLDGSNRKTIIQDFSLDEPRAIVVDPNAGLLFFSDWGKQPRIERCRMDGHERKIIVDKDITWPNGMSIDHVDKRLYWIDGKLNQIKSTRYDGTDTTTVIKSVTALPQPFDLVVYGISVYWSNWKNRSICSVNKYNGGDFNIFANARSPMGIQVFGNASQPTGVNVCRQNNGGCSHICFPTPNYVSYTSESSECLCPDYYILSADNKTCIKLDPPQNVTISTTNSVIVISWLFPSTSESITQTDIKIYKNNTLEYTRLLYYPQSSHSVAVGILDYCHQYTLQIRCRYSTYGWSSYVKYRFWPTETLIFTQENKDVTVMWTNNIDRSKYDVVFDSFSTVNKKLLFRKGLLQQSTIKYKSFVKNESNVQFTVAQPAKDDIGVYQTTPNSNWDIVDGCALLVLADKPKRPVLTYNQYPFVGSKIDFVCSSSLERVPSYIPSNLHYTWSIESSIKTKILTINSVTKSDIGRLVSCRATDDKGQVSDSSNIILLDPYYGPEEISLSISGQSLNVTIGKTMGPIVCSATCYPICHYKWQRMVNGYYVDLNNSSTILLTSVKISDSGDYRCVVVHQNDTAKSGAIVLLLNVYGNPETPKVSKTTMKSTTSILTENPEVSKTRMKSTTSISTDVSTEEQNRNPKPGTAIKVPDEGISSREVIVYSSVASAVVIIVVIGIVKFVCRRQRLVRKSSNQRHDDTRISTDSHVYDTIDESNLVDSGDVYLECVNRYETLDSSQRNKTEPYSDMRRVENNRKNILIKQSQETTNSHETEENEGRVRALVKQFQKNKVTVSAT